MPDDVNDSLRVLNAMISEWNLEREVRVNRIELPGFPNLTTDVPFWSNYEHVLLTTMAVRLRQIYALPPVQLDVQLAVSALKAFNSINLQNIAAPTIAATDNTGGGIIFLALRAAGRVNDEQGLNQTSQDVTDALSMLNEMLDEWNRERAVRVIPGVLPPITSLTTTLVMTPGEKNAIVLNLAVRLRDAFGAEVSKTLTERADRALQLLQAINLQQNPAPLIAHNDGTGYGVVFLALRAAGRVTDTQGLTPGSQDVTDAASLMNEMLDEWNRERAVKVIPGSLPTISNLNTPLSLTSGVRNAIVLNLAVRLRDWVGGEVSKTLLDRATMALQLVQANNQHQTLPLHPGPPETVIEALFLALRMAGRITDTQSVSDGSKDVADAFSLLVMMLAQWQRRRWLVWNEQEISLVSTGALSYTIGPRQDFNTTRPDKIHAAFVRLLHTGGGGGGPGSNGALLPAMLPFPLGEGPTAGTGTTAVGRNVDIPLSIIEAREDWSTITIKDLGSIPAAVFYDSAFPVGRLYFWPVPPANAYEMRLAVKATLPVYQTVADDLALPPEYVDALVNNLAVRVALASPGAQVSPLLLSQARASLNTIRLANTQIPLLSMPAALSGFRGGDSSSWAGRGLDRAWTVGGNSVLG
jgi:hypothetical protein